MTTTCLTHPTSLPQPNRATGPGPLARAGQILAALAQLVSHRALAWREGQQHTDVLSLVDPALLQDMGAPHWLKMRNKAQQSVQSYEHFKAMSRLKY